MICGNHFRHALLVSASIFVMLGQITSETLAKEIVTAQDAADACKACACTCTITDVVSAVCPSVDAANCLKDKFYKPHNRPGSKKMEMEK